VTIGDGADFALPAHIQAPFDYVGSSMSDSPPVWPEENISRPNSMHEEVSVLVHSGREGRR
jgi:hypothetical protein